MTAHRDWLKQMVGDWTFLFETKDDSEYPGFTMSGTETVKAVGDTWIVAEQKGKGSDGSDSHSVVAIGFEPDKSRFTGSHVGTAVPVLFVYEGDLDPAGKLVLETEGPAMTEGRKTDRYRDVFTIIDGDTREQSLQVRDANGDWKAFAVSRFTRVKNLTAAREH